ncbi:MAG: transcriptional repressor LexA [Xanthomonadales bacterium]|nr:transcriptional repressor LexA [Xanthomonadales bacterium]
MARDTLTPRQIQILKYVSQHADKHGFPPTRHELCERFGFRSPNAAESHLKALERKGVVQLERGRSRGIRLLPAADAWLPETPGPRLELPLVGRVAAGRPLLAEEHIEDRFEVDARLFRPRADYLLRVRGDSMVDAGILDDDLLAVHRTPEARDGQIVVARLDDEVTVKRFRRSGDTVHLMPENPRHAPITVDLAEQSLTIEGLGVGVVRHRFPV